MTEPQHANTDRLDVSLDALNHPYRRRILTQLYDRSPRDTDSFTIDSMADGTEDDNRIAIEIHHWHLPKLADSAIIEWEREADVIRRGPRFEEIAPMIEFTVKYHNELAAGSP